MKSNIQFIEPFGSAFLNFHNGIARMHHDFFVGTFSRLYPGNRAAQKKAALAAAKKLQPSVEEAMSLSSPTGFVFAGIDTSTQAGEVPTGFRAPRRQSTEEKKTDARIGKSTWLLYRLSTGLDATFVPIESDWANKWASPRGAGARITQPHQVTVQAA